MNLIRIVKKQREMTDEELDELDAADDNSETWVF